MITSDEFENVPFDIAHFRIIKYENSINGKSKYEKELRLTLRTILSDNDLIYKNEFNFIVEVLQKTGADDNFFGLMGLGQADKPIEANSGVELEGHNEKFDMSCGGGCYGSFKDSMSIFYLYNMAKLSENFILITEKGKAFVKFLHKKGYVLDKVKFEQ